MKLTLAIFLPILALIAFDYSAGYCRFTYDTSFNGLYIVKVKTCYGRLGMPHTSQTVARKPLFTEF